MRGRIDSGAAGLALALALATAITVGTTSSAQVPTPVAAGLGEATVARGDVWGAAANPAAGLGRAPQQTNGRVGYQVYGLSLAGPAPLTRVGLDLGLRDRRAATRYELGVQYFDPPGFGVTALRLGGQRRLASRLYVGLRVGALVGDYEVYGREVLPVAEGGLLYGVTPTLSAGAHYSYVSRDFSPLAQRRLRIGIDYASSRQVHLLLSASQAVGEGLNGQLGIDYRPGERLRLTAGYQTLGQRISFATAYALRDGLRVSLAAVVFARLPVGVGYGVAGGW